MVPFRSLLINSGWRVELRDAVGGAAGIAGRRVEVVSTVISAHFKGVLGFVSGSVDCPGLSPYGDSVNVESQCTQHGRVSHANHAANAQLCHTHLVFET